MQEPSKAFDDGFFKINPNNFKIEIIKEGAKTAF